MADDDPKATVLAELATLCQSIDETAAGQRAARLALLRRARDVGCTFAAIGSAAGRSDVAIINELKAADRRETEAVAER